MMFDTRVPESMANLPGRRVTLWDEQPRANAQPEVQRVCKTCQESKPISCFERNSGGGYHWHKTVCKVCAKVKK